MIHTRVCKESEIPADAWNLLTINSIFASPEFLSVWRSLGGRPRFIICEKENKLVGGLAGVIFGRGFLRRFESIPRGFTGGIHFSRDADESLREEIKDNIEAVLHAAGFMRIVINCGEKTVQLSEFETKQTTTHRIDIESFPHYPPNKKIRQHLNSISRRSFKIVDFLEYKDVEQFMILAGNFSKRFRYNFPYNDDFFERLYNLAQTDNRIIWLAGILENELIASRIAYVEHDEIVFWQLYYDPNHRSLKPGYQFMAEMLDIARVRKIMKINLGGSPEGAVSLVKFKENWGGREIKLNYYTKYNLLGRLLLKRGDR